MVGCLALVAKCACGSRSRAACGDGVHHLRDAHGCPSRAQGGHHLTALAPDLRGLDALPAGLFKAKDHQGLACRSGSEDQEDLTGQAAQDSAGYLLFADYSSGPGVTVVIRLTLCGELGASNGARTAQRTGELITLVTSLAGDAQGYPAQITAG